MLSALSSALRRGRARLPGSPAVAALPSGAGCGAAPAALEPHPCLGATRGFYWPRKNWFPWRTRIIHQRQAAERQRRHIWPRKIDPEEAPIFGQKEDGTQLAFREKEIRIGTKKLYEYAKLLRGRQIQDGIDWIESLARMKSEPILKLLKKALEECRDKHHWDLSRTYIFDAHGSRGFFIRSLQKHSRGNFGIVKSPRNHFWIRVRQMPLEEFFHRLYIYNKVPRSIAQDMRLALHQSRVSHQMRKEWAPYLCANSRLFHRRDLKWLDCTRQFDYYQARAEWIQRYKANLMRSSTEAREARGLPPLPMIEQ